MRTTHTYAVLTVNAEAFAEIAAALKAAGYEHAFHQEAGRTLIDMHGIALTPALATVEMPSDAEAVSKIKSRSRSKEE